ncbi:M15 family metallopeptidase [Anaerotignum sp.]|uniref:M15 family metallopeptidase n=1 Tax=Anaerotignum sp. TaxID=2039241 RepID=UPI00289A84E2|nr:M15 family metallopeptidase [Anaerotignum sp.]
MKKHEWKQEGRPSKISRTSRNRNTKQRKKIIRFFATIVLCMFTFTIGRASANANDVQSNSITPNQKVTIPSQINKTQISKKENTDVWNLVLVNKDHPLKEDFSVKLTQIKNGHAIDERALSDLQAMLDDARAVGLSPFICSSYRTNEKQTMLYNNQVNQYKMQGYSEEAARVEAGKWVAVPGTSEHQLGLAVDIVATSYQVLDQQQENTPEQRWLMENCYKYGFILRYPVEKSDITGIGYEPWHYRYVGKEAAAEITKAGICLEEYLDERGYNEY